MRQNRLSVLVEKSVFECYLVDVDFSSAAEKRRQLDSVCVKLVVCSSPLKYIQNNAPDTLSLIFLATCWMILSLHIDPLNAAFCIF